MVRAILMARAVLLAIVRERMRGCFSAIIGPVLQKRSGKKSSESACGLCK